MISTTNDFKVNEVVSSDCF